MSKLIVDTATNPKEATNLGQISGVLLTGLSTVTNSAVVATDSILVGVGKLQAQVNVKSNITDLAKYTSITAISSGTTYGLANVCGLLTRGTSTSTIVLSNTGLVNGNWIDIVVTDPTGDVTISSPAVTRNRKIMYNDGVVRILYSNSAFYFIGSSGELPIAVAGDIVYNDGTKWTPITKGIAGQVLTESAGLVPTWSNITLTPSTQIIKYINNYVLNACSGAGPLLTGKIIFSRYVPSAGGVITTARLFSSTSISFGSLSRVALCKTVGVNIQVLAYGTITNLVFAGGEIVITLNTSVSFSSGEELWIAHQFDNSAGDSGPLSFLPDATLSNNNFNIFRAVTLTGVNGLHQVASYTISSVADAVNNRVPYIEMYS